MFGTTFKCTYLNIRTVGPYLKGKLVTLVILVQLLDIKSVLLIGTVSVPNDQLEVLLVSRVDLLQPVTGLLMKVAPQTDEGCRIVDNFLCDLDWNFRLQFHYQLIYLLTIHVLVLQPDIIFHEICDL